MEESSLEKDDCGVVGKSSVQIQIDNADKRNSNAKRSNIKGKASHKIVSDGV
jgi:hypothetical protein